MTKTESVKIRRDLVAKFREWAALNRRPLSEQIAIALEWAIKEHDLQGLTGKPLATDLLLRRIVGK